MIEENANMPITREMLDEKVDSELETFRNSNAPRDTIFETKFNVIAVVRDAFYAMPIPEELLSIIFEHENILNEVYLFWLDETTEGKSNIDEFTLPYECMAKWLEGIKHEYHTNLLRERLTAEHDEFIEVERQKEPDEIIKDAWKIACMDDLLMAISDEDLSPQDVAALLTIQYPLSTIYDEFLSKDSENHMYDLIDTAMEVAQARHHDIVTENVSFQQEDTGTKKHIEEYLKVFGGLGHNDEQDQSDRELEP